MRHVRNWIAMLFALFITAACTDAPTAPVYSATRAAYDVGVEGCVSDGTCILEPIVVDPGAPPPDCDMWWKPDCGACMTSGVISGPDYMGVSSACPGGGTGPGGGSDPYNPGGGGPGSGPGTGDPGNVTGCDPLIHPDCEKPLTPQDTTTIFAALATMMRPASQFTDTTAAQACAQMEAWFRSALAAGNVFRGGFDSDASNDPTGEHYGLYNPNTGNIHFDPSGLDAANNGNSLALLEVAITALHEGAHWGGRVHPTAPTFDSQGRDYYTDSPFNHLNPGPNSCIPR